MLVKWGEFDISPSDSPLHVCFPQPSHSSASQDHRTQPSTLDLLHTCPCLYALSPLFHQSFLPASENPCIHLSRNGNLLEADGMEVGHEGRLRHVGQGQGLNSADGIPVNLVCSWELSWMIQLTMSFRGQACKVDKAPQRSRQLCPGNHRDISIRGK